jgi:hypothetical protein
MLSFKYWRKQQQIFRLVNRVVKRYYFQATRRYLVITNTFKYRSREKKSGKYSLKLRTRKVKGVTVWGINDISCIFVIKSKINP